MKNWPLTIRMAAFAAVVAVLVGAVVPSASLPAGVIGAVLYMQFDAYMQRRRAAAAPPIQSGVEPTRTPSSPPPKRTAQSPLKRVTAPGSKPANYRKKR